MTKDFDQHKHEQRVSRLCRRIHDALYFTRRPAHARVLARALERMELRAPARHRVVIGEVA